MQSTSELVKAKEGLKRDEKDVIKRAEKAIGKIEGWNLEVDKANLNAATYS